jgi:hypothetical protein
MRYFTGMGQDVTVEIQGYLDKIKALEAELEKFKKKETKKIEVVKPQEVKKL